MKKFYSLIVAALVSLVAYNAYAYQVTVECENYSLVKLEKWVSGSADAANNGTFEVPMTSTETVVEFPDDASYRYLYVTINSVDGEVLLQYDVYEEGSETPGLTKNPYKAGRQSISLAAKYDFGRVVLNVGKIVPDASVEVTVEGDPTKVNFSFYGDQQPYELVEGVQTVPYFSPKQTTVYVIPVGQKMLGGVTLNGEEIVPQEDWEGNFQYTIKQKDGDKIYINTNLPEGDFNITTSFLGEAALGTVVKLNGEVVEDPSTIAAQFGSNVEFIFDSYYYTINSFTKDGEPIEVDGSYSYTVMADAAFVVDMSKREFDSKVITYTSGWELTTTNQNDLYAENFYGVYYMIYNPSTQFTIGAGYDEIPFNALYDNDGDGVNDEFFQFNAINYTYASMEAVEVDKGIYVYVNDVADPFVDPKSSYVGTGWCTPNNTVIKIFIADEEPAFHKVSYIVEGFAEGEAPIIRKDHAVEVNPAEGHNSLPGTEIWIDDVAQKIKSVTVNGVAIDDPEQDCRFIATVEGATEIKIVGPESGIVAVEADKAANGAVFNLQGIRVNNAGSTAGLPAGIYIMNGKKVLVK